MSAHMNYPLATDDLACKRYRYLNDAMSDRTRACLRACHIKPDATVLELGCGIGLSAIEIAQDIVPHGHVIAIDQSESQISFAKEHARAAGVSNISFITSSIEGYLPGCDPVDVIHSRYVLSYISEVSSLIASAYDALKPEGVLVTEEMIDQMIMKNAPDCFLVLMRAFSQLIACLGGDPRLGEKAKAYYEQVGFERVLSMSYYPMSADPKDYQWAWCQMLDESALLLLEHRLVSKEQLEESRQALASYDPSSCTLSWFCTQQTIGYKPTIGNPP